MRIGDTLQQMISQFKDAGVDDPILDAQVILSHILNIEKHRLITDREISIADNEERLIRRSVKKRIKGMPVAYIIGKKEFYSLEFSVNRHVMIPRPETELLVDLTIFYAKQNDSVLDLGTGSGAIAISVKYSRYDLTVYASDYSEKALKVAKKNTSRILKRNAVKFYHGNLFSPFKGMRFNIIVSNPPYVAPELKSSLQEEILFEPEIALFANDGGRDIIKGIVFQSRDYLDEKGMLILEIGEDMVDFLDSIAVENDYSMSVLSDYAGLPRVAILRGQ
jgi:release factor glutamine methyltransferase